MCEKGVEHLMLECGRYEYARSKMLEVVIEEIGVQVWSGEMRERSVSRQMEYLLKLSTEWRSNSSVLESMKEFLDKSWRTKMRGRWTLVIGHQI